MKEPLDHIARPLLPWRIEPEITECGYNAAAVPTITREQHKARVKELGSQRAAMLTCMTCAQAASRWGTWDDNPRQALAREIDWEERWRREKSERDNGLQDELKAIAELIQNHAEEFASLRNAQAGRREWLARKAQAQKARAHD